MILTVRLIIDTGQEYTQAVEGSTLRPVAAVQEASRAAGVPLRNVDNAVVKDGHGFVCVVPVHEMRNTHDWSADVS
jgi:hypothetical protein